MAKFNMELMQRYLSPDGMQGLDSFIESMPQRVGKSILIAGAIAWATAAGCLLYANLISESTAKLRTELVKSEALKPIVPTIEETDVPAAEMNGKIEQIKKTFKEMGITVSDGKVTISSEEPKMYGAWLQSIYLVMGLGEGYKITMKDMCQGSECKAKSNKSFLSASFDVKKLNIKAGDPVPSGETPAASSTPAAAGEGAATAPMVAPSGG